MADEHPIVPDDAPDPFPVYDPSLYGDDRRCPMVCCSSMTLDDNDMVNRPLTWWLERETTKERAATLRAMLIPLGPTAKRGVPRYTCANLDDRDPDHLVCRAWKNTPDLCSGGPDNVCSEGPCWTCGMGGIADNRNAEATFVSPDPAVNSQHIAGNLPIGLLPHDEQRIDER